MRRRRTSMWMGMFLGMLGPACQRGHANAAAASAVHAPVPFKALKIIEPAFAGGLKGDWMDFGWVEHPNVPGKPATMTFANHGGWILYNPHLKTSYGGLRFAFKTASPLGDFLEVRLDAKSATVFPRIKVKPLNLRARADGFTEAFISMAELNPKGESFDRVVIRAFKDVPDEPLSIDDVGLTEADPAEPLASGRGAQELGPAKPTHLAIDCGGKPHPISPLIYGIAYAPRRDARDGQQYTLGATARRWGGNPTSRYNWELGNAWNTGSDYYFYNVDYTGVRGFTYETFLEDQVGRKLKTALTVPIIGYVAKDTRTPGFPTETFPQQQDVDDQGRAGNGMSKKGEKLEPGPPAVTSVEASPEFIGRWIHAIRQKDAKRGRTVSQYILDNEPALWNDTHRDLHPKATTYDELLDRTLRYGAAIRREDPEAVIAGPAEWGWPAYMGSALDQTTNGADRRAHGDVPLTPWLLKNVHAYEQRTGTRILNVLDLHFYPQGKGIGTNESGQTDPQTAARRIRATRALWDPKYRDESWIAEKIGLIPRMQQWIAENDPGLGISIGEWNFGAEGHMSGGLAVAEVLGRFGQFGLQSAFYWVYPPEKSPAAFGFRAFRNYDGHGAHFLEESVPTRMTEDVSLFASRDPATGGMVAVLLNLNPERAIDAQIELNRCPAGTTVKRMFTYDGDPKGFTEVLPPRGSGAHVKRVPAYSMTVLELRP